MNANKDTLHHRAATLFQENRLTEALTAYSELCATSPADIDAWQMRGAISGMLGNYQDTVDCCENIIKLKPDAAGVYINYGNALMELERYKDAISAFNEVIRLDPANSACVDNMGTLHKLLEDYAAAEACYRQAIAIAPDFNGARCNLAALLNESGRHNEAIACCRQILSLEADNRAAFIILCDCMQDQDTFEDAFHCVQEHIQKISEAAEYLYHNGIKLLHNGNIAGAGKLIELTLREFPGDHRFRIIQTICRAMDGQEYDASAFQSALQESNLPYNNLMALARLCMEAENHKLAECCLEHAKIRFNLESRPCLLLAQLAYTRGEHEYAIRHLETFLEAHAESEEVLTELGYVYFLTGNYARAMDYYQRAIAANPDYARAHDSLGATYKQYRRYTDAIASYQEAIRLDPDALMTQCGLASLYGELGRYDDALAIYDAVLENNPVFENAIAGKAIALERLGNRKLAYDIIAPIAGAGSPARLTRLAYASVCTEAGKESDAIRLLEEMLDNPGLPLQDRMQAFFYLGRLYDRTGNYDRAFSSYQTGNDLALEKFDGIAHRQFTDKVISSFSKDRMKSLPRSENLSNTPVFIIGMPRSGTSLVEQILSAHPAVYGAGELTLIRDIASSIKSATGSELPFPLNIDKVTTETLNHFAGLYLKEVQSKAAGETLITDKLPLNFIFLGLIELLFPHARIIHCVRNPIDTCLSCYFQRFKGGLFYSYKLADTALYYNTYRHLMTHWKSALTIPVFDVVYEELVADQENKSREILEFLGLDWDPGCLEFHKSGRVVLTASYAQVRKPVYKSSAGRWEHYKNHLTELFDNLEYR